MTHDRTEFRRALEAAAHELALPAADQVRRHGRHAPEELVVELDRIDVDANRVHLDGQELALLDELVRTLDSFNPAARDAGLWFEASWLGHPGWDRIRLLAGLLARVLGLGSDDPETREATPLGIASLLSERTADGGRRTAA